MGPAIRMVVCGVLLAAASVACGGQIEEEKTPDEQGSDPDKSEQSKNPGSGSGSGSGSGGGALPGGGACAGTPPHPAYPYCYDTSYPPCLSVQSSELPKRIAQSVSLGPWVGVNSSCKMLCCYGP